MKIINSMFILIPIFFIAADASIEIILENPLINETYDDAFKINNLDYENGIYPIDVFVNYSLVSNRQNTSGNFSKTINKFTKSKTSNITFNYNETYTLCGELHTNNDSNLENNFVCKNFSFENEEIEEESECISELTLMNPEIFIEKAKLKFEVEAEDYELIYWIEDLKGNIIKEKTSTNNDNTKQFTPKQEGAYILKAELISCENKFEETFFIVKKENQPYLNSKIKKENPLVLEIEMYNNKNLEKGLKIFINDFVFESDLLIGKNNYEINFGNICGDNEIIILSDDFEDSYFINTESCEEKIVYNPEIKTVLVNNKLISTIFNPEAIETEIYLKKNGRKTENSEFIESQGIFQKIWELSEEGKYEIIAKTDKYQLAEKKEYFQEPEKIEIKESSDFSEQNTPIITGNSIAINEGRNLTNWGLLGIFIFLIGDKFLKNRHSRNKHEQKGN